MGEIWAVFGRGIGEVLEEVLGNGDLRVSAVALRQTYCANVGVPPVMWEPRPQLVKQGTLGHGVRCMAVDVKA